jgi:polysaccharide pyruvyl transferase WcaK-like protein
MRLHSIIFGVIAKTPFLALSYSSKVRDFVKTLKLDHYLDYNALSLDQLKSKAAEILKDREKLSLYLEKQKLHFTYEVFKHEQILKNLLK